MYTRKSVPFVVIIEVSQGPTEAKENKSKPQWDIIFPGKA